MLEEEDAQHHPRVGAQGALGSGSDVAPFAPQLHHHKQRLRAGVVLRVALDEAGVDHAERVADAHVTLDPRAASTI